MSQTQGRLDLSHLRALVVGLAREGTALARFLADHGAHVVATDIKPASELAASLVALDAWPVAFALGGHPVSLLDDVDVVFVSPGVPSEIALLDEARRRGLPLSSETRLSTRLCVAPIAGITGSSGKTTTTALTGEILKTAGLHTWVGGNIGRPLLDHVAELVSTDVVVMELSSFQLEFFAPWPTRPAGVPDDAVFDPGGWSPHVAALLNITPNHLDRHPSMEAYIAAKSHILAYQKSGDIAVLGVDNPHTRSMGEEPGRIQRVLWFSLEQAVDEGASLRGDRLILRLDGREEVVCRTADLRLLGRHNIANVLAACTIAGALGVSVAAMREVATTFRGVEHRLELVREWHAARWYNDSIATTPERTVAALQTFGQPIVLLAGGRDKHLPWDQMAALTCRQVRHLILFGEAAALIEAAILRSCAPGHGACQIHRAGTLEKAVELAAEIVRPGDVVLLSPGGTSFDAYPDFAARGEHFRQLVRALE